MNLWNLLNPPENSPIAVVGAGGKSSFLGRIAGAARDLQEHPGLILTATTRLWEDQADMADRTVYLNGDYDVARCRPAPEEVVLVVNTPLPRLGKLEGVPPEFVCELASAYGDVPIVVEADGAAGALFKVPGPAEPVVPECSVVVVAVTAFPALNRVVDTTWIHRYSQFALLGAGLTPGVGAAKTGVGSAKTATARLGPREMAYFLDHPEGVFKGAPPGARKIWLISHVETDACRETAGEFARSVAGFQLRPVAEIGYDVLIGSLSAGMPISFWRDWE